MADATLELRQRIHKEGYDTRKTPDGHYEVIDPQGNVVRHKSGKPLRFASTPSGGRSIKNAVAMLRDANVLPKATEAKKNGKVPHYKRQELVTKSDALRGQLNEVMKRYDLTQAYVSTYADYWAAQHGIAVPSWGQGVISKFLKGTSLSNPNLVWLGAAVSAITRSEGNLPGIENMRANRQPAPAPPPPPEDEGIQVEGTSHMPPKLPRLAFDVLQTIYREPKDHEAIMALVEEVAKMELS